MNILMVSPNVVVGGAQKIMLYLAKGLEDRGHSVFILASHIDLTHLPPFTSNLKYIQTKERILQVGGDLSNYRPIDNLPLLVYRLGKMRRAVRKAVVRYRIDVVNPHNPPANWVCSFLPVPVVWSCLNHPMAFYKNVRAGYTPLLPNRCRLYHLGLEVMYEALDYLIARYGISAIVAPSEKIGEALARAYGRTADVILFALAQTDPTGAVAGAARTKFRLLEGGRLRMVQVGQLIDDKRPAFSLDVLELVRRRLPRATLAFVGDGALRTSLERDVERRGLGAAVSFLGFKGETELTEIYRESHVLLFPGLNQPWGIVPVEAVYNSVVPIVCDSSGVRDVLERHGVATTCPPDTEAFARQVVAIYDRRGEIDAWLARVRRSLAEELSFDAFVGRYERCFERALERGAGGGRRNVRAISRRTAIR